MRGRCAWEETYLVARSYMVSRESMGWDGEDRAGPGQQSRYLRSLLGARQVSRIWGNCRIRRRSPAGLSITSGDPICGGKQTGCLNAWLLRIYTQKGECFHASSRRIQAQGIICKGPSNASSRPDQVANSTIEVGYSSSSSSSFCFHSNSVARFSTRGGNPGTAVTYSVCTWDRAPWRTLVESRS